MNLSPEAIESLTKKFYETLDDWVMTRQERRDLRTALVDLGPDIATLNILRSNIFECASQKVNPENCRAVIAWLEQTVKVLMDLLPPPRTDAPTIVKFSPGEDCRDSILGLLKDSSTKVDLCVFTIADDVISREILSARNRGVSVRIITDDNKQWDLGSDVEHLSRNGVTVRTDASHAHMHHKFAIFDRKTVLSGSFNWTLSATRDNNENIFVSTELTVVKSFQTEFDRLWNIFL